MAELNNGFWKGKVEVTIQTLSTQLEKGMAEISGRLDKIEDKMQDCPIGRAHAKHIRFLMVVVGALLFTLLVTHPKEMANFLSVLIR
jgi:hypothetical protein